MKRKSSLADAVHGASRLTPGRGREIRPRVERAATKGVLLRVPVELHRELRLLALDEDTSLQALGVEALEVLLASRSSP